MANVRIVTPEGRTSFLKVFTPELNMKGDKKIFTTKILFPKSESMKWLSDAWQKACLEEFGSPNPTGLRPLVSKGNPFDDKGAVMDGDWKYEAVPDDKKELYESYRGHWVMGFSADEQYPPVVCDPDKNEILDQSEFQSGDYARIIMELSSYTSKKFRTPQVSVKFILIQKTRSGERYGGVVDKTAALSMLGDAPELPRSEEPTAGIDELFG